MLEESYRMLLQLKKKHDIIFHRVLRSDEYKNNKMKILIMSPHLTYLA